MSTDKPEIQMLLGQLEPFAADLARPDVFEIVVNGPGKVWVETRKGWTVRDDAAVTYDLLLRLARTAASFSGQSIDESRPILSAALPGGERVQIVMPPACPAGTLSVTIRKPSGTRLSLVELGQGGLFSNVVVAGVADGVSDADQRLNRLLASGDNVAFLAGCVLAKKNIIISGPTGSGKTTVSKGLIELIPRNERIITIEDTLELVVPQPNHVRLLYSKGGQGVSSVTAKDLLEAALRMRPDRILVQELRDGAAWDYLRNVNSGHPGSITTVHANSCKLAFEQLTLLIKESPGGRDLDRSDISSLLKQLVDVVVQCRRVGGAFRVTEIYFGDQLAG